MGGWLFPLETFLLPSAYEAPLVESEQQKLMREFIAQGNESIRRAEQEYMRGVRADGTFRRTTARRSLQAHPARRLPQPWTCTQTYDCERNDGFVIIYALHCALLSCPSPASAP